MFCLDICSGEHTTTTQKNKMAKQTNDFITIGEYNNRVKIESFKQRFTFKVSLKHRVNYKRVIALSVCGVNIVIPLTAFPVTNPIIYKKIMKFNKDKLQIVTSKIKLRLGVY